MVYGGAFGIETTVGKWIYELTNHKEKRTLKEYEYNFHGIHQKYYYAGL